MPTTGRCSRCRFESRSRRAKRWRSSSAGRRGCRGRSREPAASATTTSSRSGSRRSACSTDDGWNAHQFHAATEFFADFGEYDVTLTVPRGWVVGATGKLVSIDGPTHGERRRRRIGSCRPTSTTSRGRRARTSSSAASASRNRACRPSRCGCCCSPSTPSRRIATSRRRAPRSSTTARGSAPYPYEQITIVDPVTIFNPASQGEGTGGMEYPTLFTAGTRWWAPPLGIAARERDGSRSRPSVLVRRRRHERVRRRVDGRRPQHVCDGACPGRGVSRTSSSPWSGTSADWSRWAYPDVRWSRDIDGNRLNAFRPGRRPSTISRRRPGSTGRARPARSSYNKTALWLATLERHDRLGPTMQQILATHFRARRVPASDARRSSSRIASEVSGPGSDLVLRRCPSQLGDVRLRRRAGDVDAAPATASTHTVVVRRIGDGVFPIDGRA